MLAEPLIRVTASTAEVQAMVDTMVEARPRMSRMNRTPDTNPSEAVPPSDGKFSVVDIIGIMSEHRASPL
jgi:hypothetical protein